MAISKFNRKVYREKEVSLTNVDTGEKVSKLVLFSNMLEDDLIHMHEIHNRAWEADKYPSLALTLAQFHSYYENFRDTSIAAVIIENDEVIRVGGINAMRIEMDDENIPESWNACTNNGFFDTEELKGDFKKIWPKKDGAAIICPTVYVKPKVKIGQNVYSLGSLMKEIIIAVDTLANEICELEDRKIDIYAYSAPRSFYKWNKDKMDRDNENLSIEEYMQMSKISKQIDTEWRNCLEDAGLARDASPKEIQENIIKIRESVSKRRLSVYSAYKNSGGILSIGEFEDKDIFVSYSVLGHGKDAYSLYTEKFGSLPVETFLRITGRQHLDDVIGKHIQFGANIVKIIENGREDSNSRNYNILMKYPSAVPKKEVKPDVSKETKGDETVL